MFTEQTGCVECRSRRHHARCRSSSTAARSADTFCGLQSNSNSIWQLNMSTLLNNHFPTSLHTHTHRESKREREREREREVKGRREGVNHLWTRIILVRQHTGNLS